MVWGVLVLGGWEICTRIKGSCIRKGITPVCDLCHTLWKELSWNQCHPPTGWWDKLFQTMESCLVKKQSAGIQSIMEWLAQSPDFNPIELLLKHLDCMVRRIARSAHRANLTYLWCFRKYGVTFLHFSSTNWITMTKVCKAVVLLQMEDNLTKAKSEGQNYYFKYNHFSLCWYPFANYFDKFKWVFMENMTFLGGH